MNAIFVAGTDTGVGKTLVTGLLASYLVGKRKSVITQKWIATGRDEDIKKHSEITGLVPAEPADLTMPYSFRFAASPHLAARRARQVIDEGRIKRSFAALSGRYDFVIVEGTGGLLVPIGRKRLLVDIVGDVGLPVLLVARNALGAINHTLLSIEAMNRRNIPVIGMVFNNLSKTKKVISDDNRKIIEEMSGVTALGELPASDSMRVLKNRFKAIGDRIGLL